MAADMDRLREIRSFSGYRGYAPPVRIAISGTHASGKSTLIGDFVHLHRSFTVVDEPYVFLDPATGGADVSSFLRQLFVSIELFRDSTVDGDAIFERSPLDFVAYLAALATLGRPALSRSELAEVFDRAATALRYIDMLAVLPLDRHLQLHLDDEDEDLRGAMDCELLDLLADVECELPVVEIAGSREFRRIQLTAAYERATEAGHPCRFM